MKWVKHTCGGVKKINGSSSTQHFVLETTVYAT